MLASRNAIAHPTTTNAYICLSCRVKTQAQRQRKCHGRTQRTFFSRSDDEAAEAAAEAAVLKELQETRVSNELKAGSRYAKDGDIPTGEDIELQERGKRADPAQSQTRSVAFGPSANIRFLRRVYDSEQDADKGKSGANAEPTRNVSESLVRSVATEKFPTYEFRIRHIADDENEGMVRHHARPPVRSVRPDDEGRIRPIYSDNKPEMYDEQRSLMRHHSCKTISHKERLRKQNGELIDYDAPMWGQGKLIRHESAEKGETDLVRYDAQNVKPKESFAWRIRYSGIEEELERAIHRHVNEASRGFDVSARHASELKSSDVSRPTLDEKLASATSSADAAFLDELDEVDGATRQALSSLEKASQDAMADDQTQKDVPSVRPSAPRTQPTSFQGRFSWQKGPVANIPRNISYLGNPQQGIQARLYHASVRATQQATAAVSPDAHNDPPMPSFSSDNPRGIREQLRQWQELHGHEDPMPDVPQTFDDISPDDPVNNLTRLPDANSRRKDDEGDEEQEAMERFMEVSSEDLDGAAADDARFLRIGDLVEIEYTKSDREPLLAIFVQRMNTGEAQVLSIQGRWVHIYEKYVQYSVPGWIDPKLVEPLKPYLPKPESNLEALHERAVVEDLSVPRELAAPLVRRMIDFFNESQEIYRRHASTLDDAHNILAHETDLRYGSLVSAATTLLKIPAAKLPLPALYTVRKALNNAGFAFNIDRRSHRFTGYMQIRSKDQVRMVKQVRNWLRQWQDDLAATAAMDDWQLRKHKPSRGAQIVYSFMAKSREIITEQRKNRKPTNSGNVGTSNLQLPITDKSDCIKVTTEEKFTVEESEIIRFVEGWSCSSLFYGLPQLEALPPLLLQATGLYEKLEGGLNQGTGFMFLQELGTIMPYENRIRFDQHLLLPSSQHSKPLQTLMESLLNMRDNHDFTDSMAGLRHDWKDLPVYCIDDAGAQEIDDGISIESAGADAHWVHIHVANPTAFFSRDHPLAKMARHMGETIYMPERTYMMLPRWCTQEHFSLGPNRPCLTFSAKMSSTGETLAQKITPGIIRNVIRLTGKEVEELIDADTSGCPQEQEFTVGGSRPPARSRTSRVPHMTNLNKDELKRMLHLAIKRSEHRVAAGGFHFDSGHPKISVWQNARNSGLAWDHPYRKGVRKVEGDPVIELSTVGLVNWFGGHNSSAQIASLMVREFMILACELSASWCAERKIPTIYRGTTPIPGKISPEKFWEDVMIPTKREDGGWPMHIGLQYLQLMGRTVLDTEPKHHRFLGLDHYAKVTSPLRRYGDMILHWQIEAALREEAKRGKSLITQSKREDRSFLPFSGQVLNTIMLGLQPREKLIMKAKQGSEQFWIAMLMFRKHVLGEGPPLPFGTREMPMRLFVHTSTNIHAPQFGCLNLELNCTMDMKRPDLVGIYEKVEQGDIWEVVIDNVNMYRRAISTIPVRLVGREGAGIL